MASGRRSTPVRNWLPHAVFAAAAIAVLGLVLTRNGDPEPRANTSSLATVVVTSPTTRPPTTTGSVPAGTVSTGVQIPETTPAVGEPEQVETLNPAASDYLEGLATVQDTLQEIVADGRAANLAWDNTEETGVTYQETEEALVNLLQRAQALHETLSGQQVPAPLDALHQSPDGPVALAGRLVGSVEAMLEGLRIPAPDDGTARRAALADFIALSDEFSSVVDSLVDHVRENGSELGLTVMVASVDTTSTSQQAPEESTTTTGPQEDLQAETKAYTEALIRYEAIVPHLVADMTAAIEAWENADVTGVSYQETEVALVDAVERTVSFANEVGSYPVPDPLEQLGRDLAQQAEGLASAAQTVLDTFRSPTVKDGSDRLESLAAFTDQAARFATAVDAIIGYADQNGESSALTDNT